MHSAYGYLNCSPHYTHTQYFKINRIHVRAMQHPVLLIKSCPYESSGKATFYLTQNYDKINLTAKNTDFLWHFISTTVNCVRDDLLLYSSEKQTLLTMSPDTTTDELSGARLISFIGPVFSFGVTRTRYPVSWTLGAVHWAVRLVGVTWVNFRLVGAGMAVGMVID